MINYARTKFYKVASKIDEGASDGLPEIVMAGRSNAGKSSLINAIANHSGLAKVSSKPGKTRLVVYFNVDQKFNITDLPGYGYAEASKDIQKSFSSLADSYFTAKRPIALVCLLVDIRHEPSKQDKQMLNFLRNSEFNYIIIAAKADKLSRSQVLKRKSEIIKEMDLSKEELLIPVSSKEKTGIGEIKKIFEECIDTYQNS